MKDNDFIKRAVQDAEDYMICAGGIFCISEQQTLTFVEELKEGFPVHYRDLLQSAIEGVNKNTEWDIEQFADSIEVCKGECLEEKLTDITIPDNAKRSALEYIYSQEETNDKENL